MNAYFGQPWDAPCCDDSPPVPTPVGKPCLWCTLPIQEGDRGFIIGCARMGTDGIPTSTFEAHHRECQMRIVLGSPAHLDGNCTCHDGPPAEPQTPEQIRAEAIEAWNRATTGRISR